MVGWSRKPSARRVAPSFVTRDSAPLPPNRVRLRCENAAGAAVQVEPRESFYPIYWKGLDEFAAGGVQPESEAMWATIRERSYAVHVWNRKTAGLKFANGSLLHRLHNMYTVLPAREVCT